MRVAPTYPTRPLPAQPPPIYTPTQRTQEEEWEDQRFARAMENWRRRYESRWEFERSGIFNGVPTAPEPPMRQFPRSWERFLH
jgi:hypothetical protein